MKHLAIMALVASLLTTLQAQDKGKPFVNKSGELTITDMGKWEVVADKAEDKSATLTLQIEAENMHAEFQAGDLGPAFDIMLPAFTEQIKKNLTASKMQVVSSRGFQFLGKHKAYIVHCIQLIPQEGEDLVTHIISISSFVEQTFVTVSIATTQPDVMANPNTIHLFDHLKVTPK